MSLLWKDLKLLYYKDLEKILNNCKVQTEYFTLSAKDISELDLLTPIFIERYSGFYYINKVDSWIENVPTKCTIVKLG